MICVGKRARAERLKINLVSEAEMTLTVFHWRGDKALGNFGDALTVLFLDRLATDECLFSRGTIHLVGSVITKQRISASMLKGHECNPAIFWGCGKKDSSGLPEILMRNSVFLGVRGELSRRALRLPLDTPQGDSALLSPLFYTPKTCSETRGKIVWVPHVNHPAHHLKPPPGHEEDIVMTPEIPNTSEACEAFIDAIASARFIMANAMHAAVIALAYGVPFAFWSGRYINHPFKWKDFAAGVHFDLPFVSSLRDGMTAFDRYRPDRAFAAWDPRPLIGVSPFRLGPLLAQL